MRKRFRLAALSINVFGLVCMANAQAVLSVDPTTPTTTGSVVAVGVSIANVTDLYG
jgi:hypothetical protein